MRYNYKYPRFALPNLILQNLDLQESNKLSDTKLNVPGNSERPQVVESDMGTTRITSESMRLNRESFFLIVYVILALALNGAIKPFSRGFFCDDMSIRYPVKHDTIKFPVLALICLLVPWLCFRICDMKLRNLSIVKARHNSFKSKSKDDLTSQQIVKQKALLQSNQEIKRRPIMNTSSSSQNTDDDNSIGARIELSSSHDVLPDAAITIKDIDSPVVVERIGIYKIYIFGLATTIWFTGLGKVMTGRMRPHFFERCKPDVNCTLNVQRNIYIEKFNCSNIVDNSYDYFYITTSWPSGHASIAFYSMIYLIIYINRVVPIISKATISRRYQFMCQLITMSASTLLFGLAGYISMTRITDYHHHSTDVFSGIMIGSLIAILWYNAMGFV